MDDISPQTSLPTTHRLFEASAGCTFRVSFSKHCHCTTGRPHISCLHPRPGAASHTNLSSLYSCRTAHRLHCMATCRLMVSGAPWPQFLGVNFAAQPMDSQCRTPVPVHDSAAPGLSCHPFSGHAGLNMAPHLPGPQCFACRHRLCEYGTA